MKRTCVIFSDFLLTLLFHIHNIYTASLYALDTGNNAAAQSEFELQIPGEPTMCTSTRENETTGAAKKTQAGNGAARLSGRIRPSVNREPGAGTCMRTRTEA
jgi:hypothetical protein